MTLRKCNQGDVFDPVSLGCVSDVPASKYLEFPNFVIEESVDLLMLLLQLFLLSQWRSFECLIFL